ncbi:MAG: type I restriction endonuclease subunit R [Lewinellaceae bacterium]|nr:type I restriction endonuclease subunit R [Lewinellaceae bacterium]
MTQSEQALEDNLIHQLTTLGYEFVPVKDETDLLANFKTQLEKHNGIQLTAGEFAKVLNHLNKGNVFDRAKTLRDRFQITRENGDSIYIEFLNQEHWCQNEYQVTRQVSMEGKYKNRYDVTLLVNGLPLVQIELKRRGLELKEAFNQINRYQRHSYWSSHGLFQYVQVFVISNGVDTKYYANNRRQSFKQTFFWTDPENRKITRLEPFAEAFLEKCHISKMICKYIVLHESDKILMVLRPYQYYAVEALIDQVRNSNKNGYIWHTTGSGKTLTSFKASQILVKLPQVHKVVFVVDRNDLDYQTTREFNFFSEGSVDGTDNTAHLVRQFSDDTRLIVTTIQKLNNAISRARYQKKMEAELAAETYQGYNGNSGKAAPNQKRIIFLFDECHRSQFGETHKRIKAFFTNHQMFGFTGTPIFAENAVSNQFGKRTTYELFGACLHKYVLTNAIRDDNVLRFAIEYVGRYKQKEGAEVDLDIEVEDIDRKELLDSPQRLEKIADYIATHHDRKTHRKAFTAIFCVSSIETLIRYYEIFKVRKEAGLHDLRIATIFSYTANEEDKDADGLIGDPGFDISADTPVNVHSREKLDECIADYNRMYGTKHSTRDSQSFYNYYNDISKRIKEREKDTFLDKDRVDILLVVNMYLTGFDAKKVNTLYVDKNLRHHGLIQAFSRTNRILNEVKSHGNIVCFRNLKDATDDAIALFSNPEAKEVILMEPYEAYVRKFNAALDKLLKIAPTVDSVNELPSEEEELEFVKAFRDLMRLRNILSGFSDFQFEDLEIDEQTFEDYKSKYLDIHDKVKNFTEKEKVSILDDVDFELELIHRDEINVAYILRLLSKLHESEEKTKQREEIINLLGGEAQLRSKKELIEKFIDQNLPKIYDVDEIPEAFALFWDAERQAALDNLCEEEQLILEEVKTVIENYLFTSRRPLRDSIVATLKEKPKILERKTILERVTDRIMAFVGLFDEGMGGV